MQKTTIHKKVRLVAAALSATLLAPGVWAQVAPTNAEPSATPTAVKPTVESSQEKTDTDVIKIETMVVTGSRISRIDTQGPNPVKTISHVDLEVGGYSTVGDALRSLPYVNGTSLTPAASNNSFTPGANTVNLRGLGNNNVLILINGRRAAPLATPGYNGLQTVFDLDSLPAGAIEGIEVLKDGGSAIYGADAVSGVINIKLRRNYSGSSSTVEIGNTFKKDALEKSGSVVFGSQQGKLSIMGTAEYSHKNRIKDRDYSFSADANTTSRGGDDFRSYAGYPAMVYVPSAKLYLTLTNPKSNPTLDDFVKAEVEHGSYNFQSVTDQTPEVESYGFYTRAVYDITPDLYAFAELSYQRKHTWIEAAPSPVFNYNEHGSGATTGYLNIPSTNPNNPFGEDLEDEWYARLVSAGNRINNVFSENPRFVAGIGGRIANSWTWESGFVYSENKIKNQNLGTVFDDKYQAALNGVTIGGQTYYANPFGPEDPRVTATYTGQNPEHGKFELDTADISASGKLFNLPAGSVGLAIGAEIRHEDFNSIATADNISGNIIGGAEHSSIAGRRTVYSTYAELGVPITKQIEAQLAGRFEHYSDFGSATKPKIAVSYKPTDWLRFRGSFGQSFLAPNLAYLYTSQVTQFSDSALEDPKRPEDAPRQIQTRSGGNPNLKPEETDAYYAGFQIEPKGALTGLSFSVDFLEFKQKSLIAQLGSDFILAHEDTLPGKVVRNPPAGGQPYGVINYIVDTYDNIDSQTYRGIDFEIAYDWKTPVGRFRADAAATLLNTLTYTGEEVAGTYDFPKWNGDLTLEWSKGAWSAAVNVDYKGSFDNYSGPGKVKEQILVNPQVTYKGLRFAKTTSVTVGVRNIFDRDPSFDPHSSTGWNADNQNPQKAFGYVRVTTEF